MSTPTLAAVQAALDRLAPVDRDLLALLLVERLSPAEAAGALARPRVEVERRAAELLEGLRAPVAVRRRRSAA